MRLGGASNLWITSLQGPCLTIFGLAWRKSSAVPSSLIASLKPVGGLAFMSEPNSAATSFTDLARKLMAIRFSEPSALIASGNGETSPSTVGLSISSALPPPGFFISRSARSVISSSVAMGSVMRISSPVESSSLMKSRNESKAIGGTVSEQTEQAIARCTEPNTFG